MERYDHRRLADVEQEPLASPVVDAPPRATGEGHRRQDASLRRIDEARRRVRHVRYQQVLPISSPGQAVRVRPDGEAAENSVRCRVDDEEGARPTGGGKDESLVLRTEHAARLRTPWQCGYVAFLCRVNHLDSAQRRMRDEDVAGGQIDIAVVEGRDLRR